MLDTICQTQSHVTIFVFGLSGSGKSSNGNAYLQKKDAFPTSSDPESCTMDLHIEGNIVNNVWRYYIDTAGLDSTDENDQNNIINMIKSLNNGQYGINAYFLVISIHEPRITPTIKRMIEILNSIFNDGECWKQAGIIFTKCNHDDDEMPEKVISGQKYRERIINFIKTLPNCENIDIELPCFFVNSKKWEIDINTQQEYERIFQFANGFIPNVHNFQIAALTINDSNDPKKVQDLIYRIRTNEQRSINIFFKGKYRELTLDENGKVVIPIKSTLTQLYEYRLNWDPVELEKEYIPVTINYNFEQMTIFPNVQNLGTYIDHRKRHYWYDPLRFKGIRRKTSRFTRELIIELGNGFVFKANNSSKYILNSPDIDKILSIDPKCPAYEKHVSIDVPNFLEIDMA